MASKTAPLLDKFEHCSDPILLCDSFLSITWINAASEAVFPKLKIPCHISELLGPQAAEKINSCDNFCSFETLIAKQLPFAVKFQALVTSIGTGDPDQETYLITLKGFDLNKQRREAYDTDLSSLSHDLKNPLGAVFGYADALLDTPIGHNLNQQQKDIVSRIRSTAVRSIELVRNLQNISSLQHVPSISSSRKSDLNQIVDSVMQGTWREDADFPIVKATLSTEPLETMVERILIDRVIANLYTNALKFTPKDGQIQIRTFKKNKSIFFEITNNLPIISEQDLSNIFKKRFRGTTSAGIAGSGLGLFIVNEIAKRAGGTINASSNQDTGTTFTFSLPEAS